MNKFVLAVIVVAFLTVYFVFHEGDRYEAFMETAEKTTALVVRRQERIVDPDTKRKAYWVTYKYATSGGTHIVSEHVEYPDIWQRLREGQRADIYVNKDKPGESHLALVVERKLGK